VTPTDRRRQASLRARALPPSTEGDSSVTIDDVRELAGSLPRAYEVVVRGRLKFRVGSIVWLAFSSDETEMGFAFPKEWREALVEANPDKFLMPGPADLKFNWAAVRLDALDYAEMRDLVLEAWSMVVPQYVVDDYLRDSDASR
jgi:hypothetical protein